jgi:hypothetical protein
MARIAALAPVSFRPLSRPQHGVFEFVPRGRFRRQPLKGADIPTQGRGTNVMQVLSFSGKLSEATSLRGPPRRDVFSGDISRKLLLTRRDGRVAEGARLESVYTARYPGFESLSLRHSFRINYLQAWLHTGLQIIGIVAPDRYFLSGEDECPLLSVSSYESVGLTAPALPRPRLRRKQQAETWICSSRRQARPLP